MRTDLKIPTDEQKIDLEPLLLLRPRYRSVDRVKLAVAAPFNRNLHTTQIGRVSKRSHWEKGEEQAHTHGFGTVVGGGEGRKERASTCLAVEVSLTS